MFLISKGIEDNGYYVLKVYDIEKHSNLPAYYNKVDYISIHNQNINVSSVLKKNYNSPMTNISVLPIYPVLTSSLLIVNGLVHEIEVIEVIKSYVHN